MNAADDRVRGTSIGPTSQNSDGKPAAPEAVTLSLIA